MSFIKKSISIMSCFLLVLSLSGCDQTQAQYTNYAMELTDFINDFNDANTKSADSLSNIQSGIFDMDDQNAYVATLDSICDILGSLKDMNPPTDLKDDHNVFVGYSNDVIDGLQKIANLFKEDINSFDEEQFEAFSEALTTIDEESSDSTTNFSNKGEEITEKVISVLQ